MNIETVDEFNLRFYRWSLEDARREVSEGYPMIRTIKGSAALGALDYFETLNKTEQLELGIALVKRVNERALELANEPITEHEAALIKKYLASVGGFFQKRSYEYEMVRNGLSGKKKQAANKRDLRRLVKERLKPVSGDVYATYSGSEWMYSIECGNWVVDTLIDLGGDAQLRYDHEIVSPNNEKDRLRQVISLLGWLGIFHSEWNLLFDEDVDDAVEALVRCSAHFMKVAPTLLEGLSP